jgi:hypothetical protein
MSKKQIDDKKEITVAALKKILDEQDSKIMALSRETERVKRNSRIMLISCVIMVFIVVGVVFATVFWKPVKPSWEEVARFSGTFQEFESKDTDSFYISSDRWRICWVVISDYNMSTDAPPEDVEFRLFLRGDFYHDFKATPHSDLYGTVAWLKLADFGGSIGQGYEWFYERHGVKYITGSGEFHLLLLGASLEWEIIVEAYY